MLSRVAAEVSSQPRALKTFLRRRVAKAPAGSLFVGAGDSFAASGIASYLSSMKYAALDSYELVSDPPVAKGRTVYFVSVSGMTTSNLAAAKAAEDYASERVAITANHQGKLVTVTDRALFLPYDYTPRVPGTLSFSLSLSVLIRLAAGDFDCDFEKIHSRAVRDAKELLFSDGGMTYYLGNAAGFPVSLYAGLKTHEFLGWRAQAGMLEEFNHAGLFSLKKRDAVNVFCAFDPLDLGRKLCGALRRNGFRAAAIPAFGANRFEQVFYFVFLSQYAVLRKAESVGLPRPHFAGDPASLAISDSLIY